MYRVEINYKSSTSYILCNRVIEIIIDIKRKIKMNKEIVRTKSIPLSMEDDFTKVMTVSGETRIVIKNPPKHNKCYTDFVRDKNGTMVYKPKK
jgi:hypothetical protein